MGKGDGDLDSAVVTPRHPSPSMDEIEIGADEPAEYDVSQARFLDFEVLRRRALRLAALQRGFTYRLQRVLPRRDGKTGKGADTFQAHTSEVTGRVKFSYAAPQFAVQALYMLLAVHATLLYEFLGAPISYLAFFTAFARSIDVFTDPVMSNVSDSTRSKWGRRIPYMVGGCFFYALSVVMLLGVGVIRPAEQTAICTLNGTDFVLEGDASVEDVGVALWYGLAFVAFYLVDTVCNVPYNALAPELSDSSQERENIYFYMNIFGTLGTLIGAITPPLLETGGLSKEVSFMVTGVFFGTWYVVAVLNLARNVGERGEGFKDQQTVPLVPSTMRSFSNPGFRILLISWFIDAIGWFALAAMLPFYVQYFLEPGKAGIEFLTNELFLGIALAALFISALIAMPMWKFLASYFGRYKAWIAYNAWNGISNALYIFVGPQDWELALIVTVINGMPFGGKFLSDATLADCIDYDEFMTGERREAQFTVFASFVPKIVSIPAQALPLAVISALGFLASSNTCDEDGDVVILPASQPENVKFAIRLIFVFLPVVSNLVSLGVKLRYPFTTAKQIEMVSAGIAMHSKGLAAEDPITGELVPSPKDFEKDGEEKLGVQYDYFVAAEKRKILTSDGNMDSVISSLFCSVMAFSTLAIACIVGVVRTFDLLEDAALSWAPSFLQICAGIMVMLVAFNFLRLRMALALRKKPLSKGFMQRWISKTEGGGARFDDAANPLLSDPEGVLRALGEDFDDDGADVDTKRGRFQGQKSYREPSGYQGSTRNLVQHDDSERERFINRILSDKALV